MPVLRFLRRVLRRLVFAAALLLPALPVAYAGYSIGDRPELRSAGDAQVATDERHKVEFDHRSRTLVVSLDPDAKGALARAADAGLAVNLSCGYGTDRGLALWRPSPPSLGSKRSVTLDLPAKVDVDLRFCVLARHKRELARAVFADRAR